ncbi:MAG: hypothetical protein GEU98_28825 [Pseudonocardiaceae bacterium]|nr:hypothetical protein [Pseudonocardiaceae bacterium]
MGGYRRGTRRWLSALGMAVLATGAISLSSACEDSSGEDGGGGTEQEQDGGGEDGGEDGGEGGEDDG